jgi:hypothetical protein
MDQPHSIGPIIQWAKSKPTGARPSKRLEPQASETPSQTSSIRDPFSGLEHPRPLFRPRTSETKSSYSKCSRLIVSETSEAIEPETSESEAHVSKALKARDRNLNPIE